MTSDSDDWDIPFYKMDDMVVERVVLHDVFTYTCYMSRVLSKAPSQGVETSVGTE